MSAHLPFLTRLDAAGGQAVVLDDNMFDGEVRLDKHGNVAKFAGSPFGLEVGRSSERAMKRLVPRLHRQWPDATREQVQDAAKAIIKREIAPLVNPHFDGVTDFNTSSLELVGGPAENIRREPPPTLFVPGPNRVVAIQNRNVLKPGYRTNSFKIRKGVGKAVWAEPNALREVPNVDYYDEKEVRGAAYYASKYSWSIPDEWEAAIVGDDLPGELQMDAVLVADDFQERVSWWGSTEKNIEGIATVSGALMMLMGQEFSSMVPTAEQIIQRLAAIEARYKRGNNGRKPTHSIIPDADRLAMMTIFFGEKAVGESVWDRAVRQFPWVANAFTHDNLSLGNQDGTASRWIVYTNDPANLYIEHMDTMVFGPFDEWNTTSFVIVRRHGGVIAKMPEQVLYADFTK